MARPAAEIEAAMSELKAAGVHARSKEMNALREELKALTAPVPAVAPVDLGPVTPSWSITPPVGVVDAADSDEWRFIEKSLAEFDLRDRGMSVGLVKQIYETLLYKVRIWRITRAVVRDVGVGSPWPKWAELGRNDSTGEKIAPVVKPAPLPAPVAHRRVIPDQAPVPPMADDTRAAELAKARSMMGGMMGGPPSADSELPEVVEVG